MKAALPDNEAERLKALERYQVLDTEPDPAFDRITTLAARIFDVPMALVTLIDKNRQWFKSCIGIEGTETDRDVAFCAHAILSFDPLVIDDATADPRFSDNPMVTGPPFVRFYAGAPLTSREGLNLGTLCIVDTRARHITPEQIQSLVDLSRIVVDELELRLGLRARALFQKVCEMSPSLIYLFERARHERTFLGRHLVEALGYHGDRPADELLPEIVHPRDLPRLYQHLGQLDVLKDGPVVLSYRVRDVKGNWRWFLAREAMFEVDAEGRVSQVLGIATDITDLKLTEQRLAESEELLADRVRVLEGILDSAGEGIVVADENGRFAVFNPVARRIVGTGPDLGAPTGPGRSYALLDPRDHSAFPENELPLGRALRGEPTDNLELLVQRQDGGETLIRATGRPLKDARGKPRGAILTFNDITALRAAEKELARRAVTDELTRLPNRRAFDDRLALLLAEGGRGRQFALVLCDIDHFKRVNDTYGHAIGDEVLSHVAKILDANIRCTDFAARYGGEEFGVMFTDVDEAVAIRLAEKLRHAIAASSCGVAVTASFGVCANRPNERLEPTTLIKGADRALYTAKNQGRDRVVATQLSGRESIPILKQAKARA